MGLTFIDFFSGIGGFRLGMEMAGHKCIGHCEYDKYANMSYAAMHKPKESEWFERDIRNVRASEVPKADAWCFGFPCQDISLAGTRKGFAGKRSSLFFAATGLIRDTEEDCKPPILFIENVKNLLSVNRGFDFAKLLIEMDEIGYDAEWEVLDSQNFRVPQHRERVFIIGHLRGKSRREVFPIRGNAGKADIKVIGATDIRALIEGRNTRSLVLGTTGSCSCLTATDYKDPKRILVKGNLDIPGHESMRRVYDPEGVSPTLTSAQGGNTQPKIVARAVLTPDRINKRQNGRRFKNDEEPMFTLTAQDRHGVAIREATKRGYKIAHEGDSVNISYPSSNSKRGRVGRGIAHTLTCGCNQGTLKGYRIRKLTPREYFRLQGWPDEYFDRAASVCSNSQLYKQAGNGVTVNVIYEIAKKLG